jgi:hypothetical protein
LETLWDIFVVPLLPANIFIIFLYFDTRLKLIGDRKYHVSGKLKSYAGIILSEKTSGTSEISDQDHFGFVLLGEVSCFEDLDWYK